MILWLIRHGETDWNTDRRFQGWTDIDLSARGRDQARYLAARLADATFARVITSDLKRAVDTARLITGGGAELTVEPRLREINFGRFEGLTMAEIRERYPADADRWERERGTNPHGGETLDAVAARVGQVLAELQAAPPDPSQRVLISAHGGTLGILLSLALGSDPNRWWQYRLLNCAITELALTPRGPVLLRLNDVEHFAGTTYNQPIPHTFLG
jgi:alpha-ribazole phosphatase/probable phosphoglycerate mutase